MDTTYWHKQLCDKPLFPELLWSRPENKRAAGKLLIIGGNAHGFAAPAEAYAEAVKAGIGTARVLLPSAIQKIVGGFFDSAFFAPSTPSGSFNQLAVAECLEHSAWADGVLLAGDLGRNSETAILLEKFISKYSGQLTITKDVIDYFKDVPKLLLERPDTLLVVSMAQLQKLAMQAAYSQAFTFDMSLIQLVDALRHFSEHFRANIVIKHLDQIALAVNGQVSTTKLLENIEIWRVKTAAHGAVWWLQNPGKHFEAITTAISSSTNKVT